MKRRRRSSSAASRVAVGRGGAGAGVVARTRRAPARRRRRAGDRLCGRCASSGRTAAQLAHGRAARPAAAAQLLGHLVRALRQRDAAARPLRSASTPASGWQVVGAGGRQPDAGARVPGQAPVGLPVGAGRDAKASTWRARWATPAARCRSAWSSIAAAASAAQARRDHLATELGAARPTALGLDRLGRFAEQPLIRQSRQSTAAICRSGALAVRNLAELGTQPLCNCASFAPERTAGPRRSISSSCRRLARPDADAGGLHGPAQAEDADRPGVGIEHLRTRDHRGRRQGAHRQGRPSAPAARRTDAAWRRAGCAAAPPRRRSGRRQRMPRRRRADRPRRQVADGRHLLPLGQPGRQAVRRGRQRGQGRRADLHHRGDEDHERDRGRQGRHDHARSCARTARRSSSASRCSSSSERPLQRRPIARCAA